MEDSRLYDLLENGLLHKWKEKIEKSECYTRYFTKEQQAYKELEGILNEQEKQLLKSYALAVENELDYIDYNLKIKVLNFGIKIGQDSQKAFAEYDED